MKGELPRMLRPMCNSHSCSLKAKGPPGQDLQNVVFREILSSIIKNALAQIKKNASVLLQFHPGRMEKSFNFCNKKTSPLLHRS